MKILRKLARRIEITWDGGILKVRAKLHCVSVSNIRCIVFIVWAGTCIWCVPVFDITIFCWLPEDGQSLWRCYVSVPHTSMHVLITHKTRRARSEDNSSVPVGSGLLGCDAMFGE